MRCNFERLIQYLDKQLELDEQLDVLNHLDQCEACFEAMYMLSRDRDKSLFIFRPIKEKAS